MGRCPKVAFTKTLTKEIRMETDALVLRISAFTHPSLIGLQGRFLASLEMTIQESDVFQGNTD